MLLMTIAALLVLIEKTNGGFIYPRSKISFKLPKIESNFEEDIQQETIDQFLPKLITESVVSYSVPVNDLNGYNNNLSNDNIQVNNEIGDLKATFIPNQQNNLDNNEVLQYKNPANSIPFLKLIAHLKTQQINSVVNTWEHIKMPVSNIPINQNDDFVSSVNIPTIPAATGGQPIKKQSNLEVPTVQPFDINTDSVTYVDLQVPYHNNVEYEIPHLNKPIVDAPASENLQNNLEFATQKHIIQLQDISNNLSSPINLQNVLYPNIIKHIYFHVPPTEFEEPSVHTVVPKTKHVNIVFIKVPLQQRKDIEQSQIDAVNQVAPIEEKTIIYVLSKKPTREQVYVPKAVTPHEVFFVKYNGSVESAVTQISDNLEEIGNC